jgi:hypothetical protein
VFVPGVIITAAQNPPLKFEVASVKPAKPDAQFAGRAVVKTIRSILLCAKEPAEHSFPAFAASIPRYSIDL